MIAPTAPARLAAIVDWDTGTIGDPLLDIGHLLGRWTEPAEEPLIDVPAGGTEGYPSRAQMAARYTERTGADLGALPYYEALSLFKLAVILEGGYAENAPTACPTSTTRCGIIRCAFSTAPPVRPGRATVTRLRLVPRL